MLYLVSCMDELPFASLMKIYREGNRENGDELYPELSAQGRLFRAEQDFCCYLREDFFRVKGSFYAIWKAQGEFVSALRMEPYRDGYLLEALETAPGYRRRGYGKSLICAVLSEMSQQGKLPVYSHIRKGNIPSEKTHKICGFRIWKDTAVYIDGSADQRCNTWIYP